MIYLEHVPKYADCKIDKSLGAFQFRAFEDFERILVQVVKLSLFFFVLLFEVLLREDLSKPEPNESFEQSFVVYLEHIFVNAYGQPYKSLFSIQNSFLSFKLVQRGFIHGLHLRILSCKLKLGVLISE